MLVNKNVVPIIVLMLTGCVTSRVEDVREAQTGLNQGEFVVVMAKSYHQGNETEGKYVRCIERALARGSNGLNVVPSQKFIDSLFPWFEPRTAPADIKGLEKLMQRPGVADTVEKMGVRYIIWIDGETERVDQGGSLSCAAGPGGGGCFGFAWWRNDSDYEASIWDLDGYGAAGTVTADVSGTSFMPALIIPIPLIARPQSKACKALAQQLKVFLTDAETA